MATIVHRRYAAPRATPPPSTHAPDAALDNLTLIGWASVVLAVASLIVQLMPLASAGALSDGNLLNGLVSALRAVTASATIALPAALEMGLPGARNRVPWLYRGVVLLALGQAAIFGLNQLSARVLVDTDASDTSNPIVLAFSLAALAVAMLQIAGAWAAGDGLGDLGARPRKAFLIGLPFLAAAATLGGYMPFVVPAVQSAVENGEWSILLSLARLALSILLAAVTVALGVRLVDGASRRLRPRRAWITAWFAGACLVASLFVEAVLTLPLGPILLPTAILSLVLEMLGWVLLLSAFAAGLARTALIDVAPRRYLTRWVRYPAA